MKRADIADRDVVAACAEAHAARHPGMSLDILIARTGAPPKVALAAMERATSHGLIGYGVSLRTAWPELTGLRLLDNETYRVDDQPAASAALRALLDHIHAPQQ